MKESDDKYPEKWRRSSKAVKAVQVAFYVDDQVQQKIRRMACQNDISPSDMIRKIVHLPLSAPPKRPRLTASFNQQDYSELAKRYGLKQTDTLEIKKRVMEEIISYVEE